MLYNALVENYINEVTLDSDYLSTARQKARDIERKELDKYIKKRRPKGSIQTGIEAGLKGAALGAILGGKQGAVTGGGIGAMYGLASPVVGSSIRGLADRYRLSKGKLAAVAAALGIGAAYFTGREAGKKG